MPIIPGFVDTWQAKMSKHVNLTFEQQGEADYRATEKANAFLQAGQSHEDYDWDMVDTDDKKMEPFSAGRSTSTAPEPFSPPAENAG